MNENCVFSATVVIFISSYLPEFENDAKELENTYFLDKPYELKSLEKLIKMALGGKSIAGTV